MVIQVIVWTVLGIWLPFQSGQAAVFAWIDDQGGRHYSDQPQVNATPLNLQPGTGYYRIHKVIDGDTVQLENGVKVRLLGINTPEIAGHFKTAESGGEAAKNWLRQRVEGVNVSLEQDVESLDHYQRRLAYLIDDQHHNINVELVRNGLATVNIYPPNFKYLDALLSAERQAEQAGKGLWADPVYAAKAPQQLDLDNYRGWQRIRGRIRAVRQGHKYDYLQFSDSVAVQVPQANLSWFPDLDRYVGRNVEARGWVHKNREHFSLSVRHPSALRILE